MEVVWQKGQLAGQHKMLLHQLTVKFGLLPEEVVVRLEAVTDEEVLKSLSEQVLTANSLGDITLPDSQVDEQ
ncbi:MAG: DUF4351 domain-containing protein [Chloroflexi bacterium]|nr:DUF4351 domain-containing protein [Chloroflexota bacterium]MCI0579753.1 DUF4351 domain-containing protein [Chloroflexota bacterium]MCI0648320.1 DUF4351 domain-containing protein [Chloroflexota bacterium]